jgi:hypothetical protein
MLQTIPVTIGIRNLSYRNLQLGFSTQLQIFYFSDFLSKSFHHYRVQLDATVPFLFLFTKITSPFMR